MSKITDSEFEHQKDSEIYFLLKNYVENGIAARQVILASLFDK